ncbi:MAG: response regulator [Chloroflexi bacterium]|nr:response regulator [Chloroflexota bacterium]
MARILIADDDADLRTLFSLSLLRSGYDITVADDGAVAWQKLTTQAPDLLITDITMPVLDGLALLRRLRADGHPTLPVVVVSAHAEQHAAALQAGANAFLAKPVGLAQLRTVVEALLTPGQPAPAGSGSTV